MQKLRTHKLSSSSSPSYIFKACCCSSHKSVSTLSPSPSCLRSLDHLGYLLKKCMKSKVLKQGKHIHAHLLTSGISTKTRSLNSKLVAMYASCGDLQSSGLIFHQMSTPTVFAWNWMISASAFHGYSEDSIRYFSQMHQKSEALPNKFTFSCVLKACVGLLQIEKGKELHCLIIKTGFRYEISVANALIDMYCKCGNLSYGRNMFDEMPQRDVASWTSMIVGYSQRGNLRQSFQLFEQMRLEGLEPNDFTWNAMIAGYAQNRDCNRAFELFCDMENHGLEPDVVTWNAMIAGFNQSERSLEALELFREMLFKGLKPNAVTIAGLIPAFGLMGSLQKGKQIHGLIYRLGLELNVFTATGLIDMYSKCGSFEDARKVFDRSQERNVACWNAMIGCYGKHGLVTSSVHLFEKMREEGVEANQVTFTCVLSSCSHGGLVQKGLEIFEFMRENYRIGFFSEEHYSCLIDLLCRAGQMKEAYKLIKEMPIEKVGDSVMGAFLSGCKVHGRGEIEEWMEDEVLQRKLEKAGGFVLLSNIYAAAGKWEEVENVRNTMRDKGIVKKPGCSWVEKKDGSVGFRVGKIGI